MHAAHSSHGRIPSSTFFCMTGIGGDFGIKGMQPLTRCPCLRSPQLIKYGVVGVERVRQDLLDWNSLYIAGRMHKPVISLQEDPVTSAVQQTNLESALSTSLLLLPNQFTTQASLPYAHAAR